MRKFQGSCTGEGSLPLSYVGCSISLNVKWKAEVLEKLCQGMLEELNYTSLWGNWLSLYSVTLWLYMFGGMKGSRVGAGIFNWFSAPSCTTHCCAWQYIGSQGLLASPGEGGEILSWCYVDMINFQQLEDLSHPKLLWLSVFLVSKIFFWVHFFKAIEGHYIARTIVCEILFMWYSRRLRNV